MIVLTIIGFFVKITPDIRVKVSKHALQRFRERFAHKFPDIGYSLYDDKVLARHIITQMKYGRYLNDWRNNPFYLNKIGHNIEVFENQYVFFICTRTSDTSLLIKTCVSKFLYYKHSEDSKLITTSGGARWTTQKHLDWMAEQKRKLEEANKPVKKRLTRW